MVTYLEMNRLTWKCSEVEETAMLQHAAAGKMKEGEWEAWGWGRRNAVSRSRAFAIFEKFLNLVNMDLFGFVALSPKQQAAGFGL